MVRKQGRFQTQQRIQAQIKNQERNQVRARLRSSSIRTGLDSLDTDPDLEICLQEGQDVSASDGLFGDEIEEQAPDFEETDFDTDERDAVFHLSSDLEFDKGLNSLSRTGLTIPQITGRRIPPLHVRLTRDGDCLRIHHIIGVDADQKSQSEAAEKIVALVAHAFRLEQKHIWKPLLEETPPSSIQRISILGRLALKPDEWIPVGENDRFRPNDLGSKRFDQKFALFPDGIVFSVGLLLRDDRGHKHKKGDSRIQSTSSTKLADFSDAFVLSCIQQVFDHEILAGKAMQDGEFAKELRKAVSALTGERIDIVTDDDIRNLRTRMNRYRKKHGNGYRELLPNRIKRQQEYDKISNGPVQESEVVG